LKDEKLAASLLLGIIVLLAPVALKANEMILGADRAFIAERQLYVPAIFFALLIPEIIRKFKHLQQSKYLSAALIGVIALFIYLSHTTNVVWANSEVLTDRFIKNYPNSQVSNITLGNKLLAKGDTAGALEEFKKALPAAKEKVLPKNDKIHREAPVKKFKNLAALLDKYNIAAYQPAYASVHYHIGRVYLAKNDLETAQRKFKTVLVLQPHFVEARVALARIYMEKRLFPDASREYKLALKDIEVFRVP
jgi:tetratricopeptide (TPR) repeat protein